MGSCNADVCKNRKSTSPRRASPTPTGHLRVRGRHEHVADVDDVVGKHSLWADTGAPELQGQSRFAACNLCNKFSQQRARGYDSAHCHNVVQYVEPTSAGTAFVCVCTVYVMVAVA